ncbi:type II toxin-antitoxin system RelE/ParE family toxin [bacterium]|nr:type II toxin-antitoxin system RelE/ParE family toxin [bacterium]
MKLIWTEESLNKLIEIEEFIAEDNPIIAIEFVEFLIDCAEEIANNPNRGRAIPEFGNPKIRELIQKNYRIIYQVTSGQIEILTVFEAHRLIRRSEIIKNG